VPLLSNLGPAVWASVRAGVEGADNLQPSTPQRDNHFWAHCARFYNKRALIEESDKHAEWVLIPDVPNTGIHVVLNNVHRIRVLRSLNGNTPPPGRNRARREAWAQPSTQGEFYLTADNHLLTENDGQSLPAFNLILDWHLDKTGEPAISVSLPRGPWQFKKEVRVHWRVRLPGSEEEFAGTSFDPPKPSDDEFGNLLQIDDDEIGESS
jgi:hypothetical protein